MFLFLLNFLPRIILAPLLVTIEKELHLGHQEVGVFFLLISSGYCLTLLLSGFVSSRLSHKTCIVLSTLAVGMALLWISGSSTLRGMRLGLIALGMAAGIYIPSGIATLTGLVNPKHLGKALAIHEMAPSLSFVVAPFLGEIFLRLWTWRGLLGFLGGCALITGCVFAWVGRGGDFRGQPPSFGNLKFILTKRSFWILLILFSLAMGASVGVFTMMPLFLVSERGMDRGWANVFVALSRVLGLLAVLVAGHSVRSPRMEENPHDFSPGQWHLDSLAWDCSRHGIDTFCVSSTHVCGLFLPCRLGGDWSHWLRCNSKCECVTDRLRCFCPWGAELSQPGLDFSESMGPFPWGSFCWGASFC